MSALSFLEVAEILLEDDEALYDRKALEADANRIMALFNGDFPTSGTRADWVQAVKLYEGGFSAKDIGHIIGTDRHRVRRWLQKAGVKMRKTPIK